MTTTVAVKNDEKIVFASDSAGSNSNRIWIITEGKFFKLNDDLAIGYAGSFREEQIIKYDLSVPTQEPSETDDHFMYNLANAIKSALVDKSANKDADNCISNLIICYKNRLFHFSVDFQIVEYDGVFEAIGSGQCYAIGAMETLIGEGISDPEIIARKAIEVAIKYDPWTVGPVHIMQVNLPTTKKQG